MSWLDIERHVPITGRRIKEDSTTVNIADLAGRQADSFTIFNETKSVQRTTLFSFSSIYPLSLFRDYITGTVTHDVDKYLVTAGSILDTANIGRYVSGYEAEAGIGVRLDSAEAEWGYFDENDGIFFRYTTANSFQLVVKKGGVDILVVSQEDFNGDPLDGTGSSGIDILNSLNEGYIFQVQFSWYGYGPIVWEIVDKLNANNIQPKVHIIHSDSISQQTSLNNVNLPVRGSNIGGSGTLEVSGRQFSILGKFRPERRAAGIGSNTVTVDTTWTPVVSFRRIAARGNFYSLLTDNVFIINEGTEIVDYQLLLNPVLTGDVPTQPDNRTLVETAVEFDLSATDFTGGEVFYSGLIPAALSGQNQSVPVDINVDKRIPRDYWVTLVAKARANTAGITAHIRAIEEW